jgi:hypothetical protein
VIHHKHQYRAAMCGHKAVEVSAVCVLLMVQGDIAGITLTHLGIASKTGLLGVFPILAITYTRYARHLTNRWAASALLGLCTFAADAAVHASHYPGALTEAALTGTGAFLLSVVISYTRLGKKIDRLAEPFVTNARVTPGSAPIPNPQP